ncbi:unnamed protein product [Closterium sp. NIES-54]
MWRPCPAAAPVAALPCCRLVAALPCCRPVAALPCCRPCRGPALLPPYRGPALLPPCRGPALLPPCRGPALTPPSGGPALLPPQSRPCTRPCPAEPCRPAEPRRPTEPHCPAHAAPAATAVSAATAATATTAATAAMASPTVLTFNVEGRAVDFDVWVDDLQLFLQCDSKDGVSLFDHTSGVSPAPAATADSTVRSQWTTRDAVARLAVRSHLPSSERAHFGQYKSAKSLYDAVVARYSSPATAALNRLMLPYLFSNLAAFATVADLIAHLRTSDARYRAALPTEFCAKNPHPMYITLYYLVTRLPDSLASVLLAATLAPLSLRGVPLSPFSPLLLLLLLSTSLALRRSGLRLLRVGGATTARARGARVVKATMGAAVEAVGEVEGVAVEVGVVAGVGASVAAVGVVEAAAAAVEAAAAVVEVAAAVVLVEVEPRSVEALVVASARGSSRVPVRPRRPSSFVSGTLGVGGLGVLVPALTFFAPASAVGRQIPDAVELPRWGDLLRQNVAIFDLDFDAILAAMYAVTDSAEGDCYLCVPPDPGIEAAALGASASTAPGTIESAAPGTIESAAPGAGTSPPSGTAPTKALHTFTLDSGASRSFFPDSTTLTPLSRPVAASLANPSGGTFLAHSSKVLPCPAAPSGLLSGLHLPSFSTNLVSGADLQDAWVDQFTPGGQRVTRCTCSRTGRHLATFTHRHGSSLYTLTTASTPVTASGQVSASSQVFAAASRSGPVSAPCSCRPLSHETLLWHHHLGHPSLPRLRGMASRTLVSGLPRSLPPLPPGPAPTCVPCVEGRQRAAPHSSEFPPTEAPLQTLHMDVWGPARVSGQGHERYFLLVVDDYSRYTTVFPLCCKGEVTEVLIDWIRGAHCQLSKSFCSDLPVLRLHSDRGAFVRDTSADNLSSRAVPCIFLGFPLDAPGWQFYHPTSRRVLSSQDITFDESGPAPSGVSQVDPVEPVEVAVDSSAARGTEPAGAGPGGAVPGVSESEVAEPGGAKPEVAEPGAC